MIRIGKIIFYVEIHTENISTVKKNGGSIGSVI